jgi:hypothetical protein
MAAFCSYFDSWNGSLAGKSPSSIISADGIDAVFFLIERGVRPVVSETPVFTRNEPRMRYLCEAYQLGITIRNNLHHTNLVIPFEQIEHPLDAIQDGYLCWHPAPSSFRSMGLAFVFMEITGDSYAAFTQQLTRQPEVATLLGFSHAPDESAFSRTWRNRFHDAVREYVQTAAHFVVKEVQDFDIPAPEVRPKEEMLDEPPTEADSAGMTRSHRTISSRRRASLVSTAPATSSLAGARTRPTRTHIFSSCRRSWAWLAVAPLRALPASSNRPGEEYGQHGDTLLRGVKQFSPEELGDRFNDATDRLPSVIASEASL